MEFIRETLENIERIKKSVMNINETEGFETATNNENVSDSVPFTSKDELLTTSLETAKAQFGANFEGIKNPMLYKPNGVNPDITLIGRIPDLKEDVTFEMSLKDGCSIYSKKIILNGDAVNTLKVVYGFYKNWKEYINRAEDKKPMKYKNNANIQRGDDID